MKQRISAIVKVRDLRIEIQKKMIAYGVVYVSLIGIFLRARKAA